MSTARPLLAALLKDAAIFPPGNAPMAQAVRAHAALRTGPLADLVGPFVCSASRLDELARSLPADVAMDLALVVDTGTGSAAAAVERVSVEPRLSLRTVEVPLRDGDLRSAAARAVQAMDPALGDAAGVVEVSLTSGWRAALDVLAEAGYAAKLRLGGATRADVPPAAEVAGFVVGCLDREVPFTLTAGLHHAVAAPDRHGFLNVMVATRAALDGAGDAAVEGLLASADGAALAASAGGWDHARAASVRRWFLSFGTCSVDEPVADLRALGLLT